MLTGRDWFILLLTAAICAPFIRFMWAHPEIADAWHAALTGWLTPN